MLTVVNKYSTVSSEQSRIQLQRARRKVGNPKVASRVAEGLCFSRDINVAMHDDLFAAEGLAQRPSNSSFYII
jgi:hypothetical protein